MPRIHDILATLQSWAPPAIAWERDNIGLLVGDGDREVARVLVCLDVTPAVVDEAVAEDAQLIVAHHPLIFHPLKSLRTDSPHGAMLAALLRADIGVIAVHTNADATWGGLNHALAHTLGLTDLEVLDPTRGELRGMTVRFQGAMMFVEEVLVRLRAIDGVEAYPRPMDGNDAVIDIIAASWNAGRVRAALHSVLAESPHALTEHRFEHAAPGYGIGAVGHLARPRDAGEFLADVKAALGNEWLRVSPFDATRRIHRVAVCSGAGSSYVRAAIAAGADAYVTGDLSHHVFLDHRDEILLVDAGHYHTERIFIDRCAEILAKSTFENSKKIDILRGRTNTNPIRFV